MHENFLPKISEELQIPEAHVTACAKLLVEGGTVPFIARYRKEATGGLDEVQIANIRDRLEQLKALEDRRAAIIKSLEDQKLLTDELKAKVNAAETMARLEDVYLPYKPKRRTKATIAREKGLEPLAETIFQNQEDPTLDPAAAAAAFVSAEKEVADTDAALAGARDIIAEWINDDADARAELREFYTKHSTLTSKVMMGKEEEGAKFRDYFDWSEPAANAPSHRILAIRRGEQEMFLSMSIRPDEEQAVNKLEYRFVKGSTPASDQVRLATRDSFKRLLSISMETAARLEFKKRADAEAIKVFVSNIRELLLAPALGERPIIAIDPGFRTGCKTVVLDAQGKLLFDTVIYPSQSQRQIDEAKTIILGLANRFQSQAIAIGNGTAGRETETFVRSLGLPKHIAIVMVNESGASIYSASDVAREEFPDKDITVRGAVSIGRRLMDPLAELVKIDPKSIGVGQYQHDVDQRALKASLDDSVLSCVNAVGVEVNTASKQLLSYVSGLNPRLAGAIVAHREANGPFTSRKQITKVAGIGPKAYEQAAGFLRIRGAENPLDASAVHPERYGLVEQMAFDVQVSLKDLIADSSARKKIDIQKYTTDEVGLPTLQDIVQELAKPGRDPRAEFELIQFKEGVNSMADLTEGMKLTGVVTNVTAFGAFIDIGVHQDGLAHISQLSDNFVKDPNEVVKVGQKVSATVTEVDIARKRIGLSLKTVVEIDRRSPAERAAEKANQQNRGPRPQHGGNNRNAPRGGTPNRGNNGGNNRSNQSFGGLGDVLGKLGL